MTLRLYAAYLVVGAVTAGGPLALAHYGRSPDDRLDRPLALSVAGLAITTASLLAIRADPFLQRTGNELLFVAGIGVIVGFVGLGAYGVVERLLRPKLSLP